MTLHPTPESPRHSRPSQARAVPAAEGNPAWHTISNAVCAAELCSSSQGLSDEEAALREKQFGKNELQETQGNGLGRILWEQASSTMILILVVAGILSLIFKAKEGFPVDAAAIFSIVFLFVVLGTLQEYRAQKAIAALKKMSAPVLRAMRDGKLVTLKSNALVPGDVIHLEAGQTVPADARLFEVQGLKVQESALTGESEPIEKHNAVIESATLPIGDRKNMVWMGSMVTFGRAQALVVSTGQRTELGRIATLLQSVEKLKTPLQKKLDRLGKTLAIVALAVAVAIAFIGVVIEGKSWAEVLVLSISIAVAIVPEGLPAVLTFTLALAAQRMLKRKALVRKLPAVETLGSVTVICSDKTGTLTQNHMTVMSLADAAGHKVARSEFASLALSPHHHHRLTAVGFALSNDAVHESIGTAHTLVGDPTEIALVEAAECMMLNKAELEQFFPRVGEFAFDSDRKLMTTVHKPNPGLPRDGEIAELCRLTGNKEHVIITKGAFEEVLARCVSVFHLGKCVPLVDEQREAMTTVVENWAKDGQRVLALAARGLNGPVLSNSSASWECDLTFFGLCAMIDPPREEAQEAIRICQKAGIRVVMITDDHPVTAKAIARALGICNETEVAMTGVELASLDEAVLAERARSTRVYARVSPEQKLRIVNALQFNGEVVAMTGDGVNDGPALRQANIGVAMGTGTDVAKEAADIVLLDDNFATIVAAVEEGRTVFDNLRRFVMFSLAGNVAKVIAVALSPLLGLTAMLTPMQILFSNLLTDGLLGLGMGLERREANTMSRPPYPQTEPIFARGVGLQVILAGPFMGAVLIGLGFAMWPSERTPEALTHWGTLMFTALAFIQLARAFSARSFTLPVFRTGLRGNSLLLSMVCLALVLQLASVYVAPFQPFFNTTVLRSWELMVCIATALGVLVILEVIKASTKKFA